MDQRHLSFSCGAFKLRLMSTKAQTVLEEFRRLAPDEQRLVWNELARTSVPANYGHLSDQELTDIADQTFVLLDKEEADAQSR
jgi:hypothetical protein